jgi:hypothetical protein
MKALSIRQPWTAMITHGQKRTENRSRRTTHRGLLALHASGRARWDADGAVNWLVRDEWQRLGWSGRPDRDSPHITHGAVLAIAEVVDVCNGTVDSLTPSMPCDCDPWAAEGQYHWRLTNVRPLAEPVECRGALGLWTLPDDVEAAVVAQLSEAVRHG